MTDDRQRADRSRTVGPESPADVTPPLIAYESEDGIVVCDPSNPRAWFEAPVSTFVDLETSR